MSRKVYRCYDPRLKNLVAKLNDISHFYKLGIPKSTLKQWKICGPLDYFSIPELDFSDTKLLQENVLLKSQLSELGAEYLLVKKTLTIFGFQVQFRRLPNSTSKAEILSAIKDTASVVSLKICLEAIGLTAARYRSWLKRQVACLLKDLPSCPRMSPTQLVLHILCLDGVFSEVGEGETKAVKFRNVPTLSDLDTENILKCMTTKILKHLKRKGYLSPTGDVVQNPEADALFRDHDSLAQVTRGFHRR